MDILSLVIFGTGSLLSFGAKSWIASGDHRYELDDLLKRQAYQQAEYNHTLKKARENHLMITEQIHTQQTQNEFTKEFAQDASLMAGYASGIDVNKSISYQRGIQLETLEFSFKDIELKQKIRNAHAQYQQQQNEVSLHRSNLPTEKSLIDTMDRKQTAGFINDAVEDFGWIGKEAYKEGRRWYYGMDEEKNK